MDRPTFVEGFHENQVPEMTYAQLGSTDMVVSKLGLGGAAFSGFYGEFDDSEAIATVEAALKAGINYIDTAPYYGAGRSETLLGKALQKIPRKAYYISTKVGRYTLQWETMFDYSKNRIVAEFDNSLKKLGISYTDIVIVHDVEYAEKKQILEEALPAVRDEIINKGKARFLAISGYPLSVLWEVIAESKVKIDVVLTYTRDTLIDASLNDFAPLFASKGVGIINATPTAMSLLTCKGPEPWHPASEETKKLCAQAANYCKENGVELGTLAVNHTLNSPNTVVCLVGIISRQILNFNLNLLRNGLSSKEIQVLKYIKEKFFTLAKNHHWEGVEVEIYQNHMASLKKH